jgi:hypothetical protein
MGVFVQSRAGLADKEVTRMVRQIGAWMVMGTLIAGVSGAALAQGTTPAKPATPAKPTTPAAPAAAAAATQAVRGTLKSLAAGSLVVSVGKDKASAKDMTFVLAPDTKYTKDGKPVAAKDLAPNDPVRVQYVEAGGKLTATEVTSRTRPPRSNEAQPKS